MEEVINKLKKQYGEEFNSEKSDSGAVKLTVNIRVNKKEEQEDGDVFSASVVLDCAPDYPESLPSVRVAGTGGISAEAATQLTNRLAEVAAETKGSADRVLLLVRIARRILLDQRTYECPNCKADLQGSSPDAWRSRCGHFYHRNCIISLIQNSARAQEQQQENQEEPAAERRPVCPACGLYEFALRDDKPVSRRIGGGRGGGGRFRRRGRNRSSAGGEGGEGEAEGEDGQGDQRRRRPRKPRNRRGGGGVGGENDAAGGEGEGEGEGEGDEMQRRRRRKPGGRRRRQNQRSGGEGDIDAEGGEQRQFNQRRQADMRFNQFEQYRNQVGKGGGGVGEFPQPGYIDENGGFYAPDGYYYYAGPSGFYAALEAYGRGGAGGGGGPRGGGRRRNRPRRPRGGDGSNDNGGIVAEDAAIQSAVPTDA